jgi:DNA-binding NarL/FixJ family response regulator
MTARPVVLALIDDLMFRSKLDAAAGQAGAEIIWIVAPEQLTAALAAPAWRMAIIDLGWLAGDPLDAARAIRRTTPQAPVIAYFPHVQAEQRRAALDAGCTDVLPRSAFVQRLPALLRQA